MRTKARHTRGYYILAKAVDRLARQEEEQRKIRERLFPKKEDQMKDTPKKVTEGWGASIQKRNQKSIQDLHKEFERHVLHHEPSHRGKIEWDDAKHLLFNKNLTPKAAAERYVVAKGGNLKTHDPDLKPSFDKDIRKKVTGKLTESARTSTHKVHLDDGRTFWVRGVNDEDAGKKAQRFADKEKPGARIKKVERIYRKGTTAGNLLHAASGGLREENLVEVAPPGEKYERMVKHIKGKNPSKKQKEIAYATAWKRYKKSQVNEALAPSKTLKDTDFEKALKEFLAKNKATVGKYHKPRKDEKLNKFTARESIEIPSLDELFESPKWDSITSDLKNGQIKKFDHELVVAGMKYKIPVWISKNRETGTIKQHTNAKDAARHAQLATESCGSSSYSGPERRKGPRRKDSESDVTGRRKEDFKESYTPSTTGAYIHKKTGKILQRASFPKGMKTDFRALKNWRKKLKEKNANYSHGTRQGVGSYLPHFAQTRMKHFKKLGEGFNTLYNPPSEVRHFLGMWYKGDSSYMLYQLGIGGYRYVLEPGGANILGKKLVISAPYEKVVAKLKSQGYTTKTHVPGSRSLLGMTPSRNVGEGFEGGEVNKYEMNFGTKKSRSNTANSNTVSSNTSSKQTTFEPTMDNITIGTE